MGWMAFISQSFYNRHLCGKYGGEPGEASNQTGKNIRRVCRLLSVFPPVLPELNKSIHGVPFAFGNYVYMNIYPKNLASDYESVV